MVIGGAGTAANIGAGQAYDLPSGSASVVLQGGATLSASQVFLTSNQITLEPGSSINTLGSPATPAGLTQDIAYGDRSSALVALSNGHLTLDLPIGTGSISVGTCLTGDTCGTGPVVLYTQGTLGLSTQGTLTLSTNVQYGARYITLNVADINAGTDAALAAAAVPAGLTLSSQLLASLVAGNPSAGVPGLLTLMLSANQSFNFYGNVTLSTIDPATGQSGLQELILNTPAIYGYGAPGDVATLDTGTLVWNGAYTIAIGSPLTAISPPAPTANGPGTGAGTLDIVANQIVLGYPAGIALTSENVSLPRQTLGFSTVNLTGTSQIAAGNIGSLSVYQAQDTTANSTTQTGGTLNLITPLLVGTAGGTFGFTAGTAINIQSPTGIAPSTFTQAPLGASLTFTAGSVSDSTAIVLPSGSLSMTATVGDVTLGAGSQLVLSGQTTQYFDQSSYSWGGSVSLESTNGNVTQDPSGLIDVSAVNNNAGSINVTATAGTVALNGTINGSAAAGYTAGSINIRTGTMTPDEFTSLNEQLDKGGVFGSRGFDIGSTGSGNPTLVIGNDTSGNAVVQAQNVSVSVDQGNLEVSGIINASGPAPGTISLSAGGNLTLDGTAVLDAHGTVLQVDSTGAAIQSENTGAVTLTTVTGLLALDPNATINVSAPDGYAFGQINLNAPRLAGTPTTASATGTGAPANAQGTDIDIAAAGPLNIQGASSIAVNGFATYTNAPLDPSVPANQPTNQFVTQAYLDLINQDSVAFINAAWANANLQARLAGLTAYGGAFHLRPGVQIDSLPGGNLTVPSDLNLSSYRYGPNADTTPDTPNYGSGEPGVLVLRAANNLSINGSITDGFATPPKTPDDNGWVLTTGTPTTAAIVYEGSSTQTMTVVTNATNPTFPNDTLSYAVDVTNGTLLDGTSVPVPVSLVNAVSDTSRIAPIVVDADIVEPNGTTYPTGHSFAFGSPIPAGTILSPIAGHLSFTVPSSGTWTVTTTQTLAPATVSTTAVTLGASVTTTQLFMTTAAITLNGNTLYAAGATVPSGTTIPTGATLGAGFLVPNTGNGNWVVPAATWPANTSLAAFSTATIQLADNDVIPAGTVYQGSTPFSYRTGQIWAVAPMLPAGDLSWSISLVAGADLAAADDATLQAASALAGGGNITLADAHSSLDGQPLPSVIRTGTGSLQILAGGDVTEDSLFGIYTAGTQSSGVSTLDNTPLVDLAGPNSPLGTAGGSTMSGVVSYNNAVAGYYQAYYPQDGGNLTLSAQGALTEYVSKGPDTNAIGDWLWRQAIPQINAQGEVTSVRSAWWINFGTYALVNNDGLTVEFIGFSGIGALGGGNVAVSSGGNASGLSITVASTGRTDVTPGTETLTGGGTLSLTVGGELSDNVAGDDATLTDLRGNISVLAGSIGSMTLDYGSNVSGDPRPNDGSVAETLSSLGGGPEVVIGDGTASFSALGNLVLAGAGDATREDQLNVSDGQDAWFSLWQPTSAVTLFSAGGNVAPITETIATTTNDAATDYRYVYPPNLSVTAASGSIYVGQSPNTLAGYPSSLELAPSAQGQLSFLAAQSIYDAGAQYTNPTGNGAITLPAAVDISGANPALLPTPLNAAYSGPAGSNLDPNADSVPNALFALALDTPITNLQANDPTPALFYAAAGDIVGLSTGEEIQYTNATWYIAAKPVQIIAGRDIVELGIPSVGQGSVASNTNGDALFGALIYNPSPTDVSEIIAGRDIIEANVFVAGAGSLYVQAGRNLYQPSFQQNVQQDSPLQNYVLESIGPLVDLDPANRDGGADITVLAGTGATGPDWTAFASLYLNPANLADPSTPLQDQPGRVERTYQTQLLSWLQQRFGYTGAAAGEMAYFDALPIQQQRVFLLQVYFDELNQSGLDYNDPTSRFFQSYLEGNDAIAALFPGGLPQIDTGDVTMLGGSGIHTDYGGTISLIVPGGDVMLGVEGGLPPPSSAGLLTQGSGDIDIYSDGSVELGQSRIFTTFGGNIVIWSADGDINAGRGAKSTVVFSPAQITYGQIGDIFLSPTVPSTGAGIATLAPIPAVPPGNINLVAPLGVIDAGEAGIRASGNANLAALGVLNAANIQVQGKTTGIPVVAVPNVAAETAGNAAAGAAQQAADRAGGRPTQNLIPSIFIIDVISFGCTDQAEKDCKRSQ
ncbi:filamentous haemagglutinin family protein [Acidisphaera sp. S103]|uniref:filamentous haemagglutinin family protein n=1 Tax=Acidisphaera sp. S103 TaxID=1747223 RepID=UPI001C207EF6|nr:filamentous haemagglutinin family protein [Acidisphaera sp. S103]